MSRFCTLVGQAGLCLGDPAAQLADGDPGGARRLPVEQVGPFVAEDERRLVHDADLERVGDLLQRRDVAARHLVAADLSWAARSTAAEHRLEFAWA